MRMPFVGVALPGRWGVDVVRGEKGVVGVVGRDLGEEPNEDVGVGVFDLCANELEFRRGVDEVGVCPGVGVRVFLADPEARLEDEVLILFDRLRLPVDPEITENQGVKTRNN